MIFFLEIFLVNPLEYTHTRLHTHACTHTHTHTCTRTHRYIHTHTHIYIYICVCVCVCVCRRVWVCTKVLTKKDLRKENHSWKSLLKQHTTKKIRINFSSDKCCSFFHVLYLRKYINVSVSCLLIGIILRWGFLIWELIFYSLRTFCPHHGSFLCFFFFTTWCNRQQLWKAIITGDTVTRFSIPIRGRG